MSLTTVDEASKIATTPRAATREELPVLDLGPLLRGEPLDALAKQLRHVCETIGFFYIINHGVPQKVELQTSSGFERLDKAGMDAAMRWRYVPGKRGGVAEAMWFLQPITFNLKKE